MEKDTKLLGCRLKFFRERNNFSQFLLELEINASHGSLSRIENGSVEPTRDTISKIEKILKLTDVECSYLSGSLFNKATNDEVNNAKKEVSDYFSKPGVLAYIIDDRYRFIDLSNQFFKFLNIDIHLKKQRMMNRSFVAVVLDKEFGILEHIYPMYRSNVINHLLERFYSEMGFMKDDEFYLEAIKFININPIALNLWEKIQSNPPINLHNLSKRKINFNVAGFNIPLFYSNEPLHRNRRFIVIEYSPTIILKKVFGLLP